MARSEARIFTTIWADADFRALPREIQFMYFFLLSQPDLSHCGVVPYRPARWAPMSAGSSQEEIEADIRALEISRPPFVITDKRTGELLIRSLVRRDGMLASPKMVRPVQAALYEVESAALRQVLATELQRCLAEGEVHPDYVTPRAPKRGKAPDALDVVIKKLFPQVDTLSDTLSGETRIPYRIPHTIPNPIGTGTGTGTVVTTVKDLQTPPASGSAGLEPGALTVTQRSKRITDAYAQAEPMCKWPAVNGVVIKAIKSERFTDDEIRDALLRMAAENRSVTVDSLRTELGGLPPSRYQKPDTGPPGPARVTQKALRTLQAGTNLQAHRNRMEIA